MFPLLPGLKAILLTSPTRWEHLIAAFPDDLIRRQPRPGEWSALECLYHVADLERNLFPARIRAFMTGTPFPPFEMADAIASASTIAPRDLAGLFATLRQDNIALLDAVRADQLDHEAQHPTLGTVTLRQLLHEWGAHDLMHIVQAEQALMQPYIDEMGAWQYYFMQHWVNAPKR